VVSRLIATRKPDDRSHTLRRKFAEAITSFTDMSLALEFEELLTVPAYRLIA